MLAKNSHPELILQFDFVKVTMPVGCLTWQQQEWVERLFGALDAAGTAFVKDQPFEGKRPGEL